MDANTSRPASFYRSPGVLASVVAAASILAYINTLGNGFVYDDNFMILGNRWLHDASSIPEIFGSSLWGFRPGGASNYYRPLVHLVFMVEYALFGDVAWPYHLVNTLAHAANSVLVFVIAIRLAGLTGAGPDTGARRYGGGFAFIAAILFALHPVHVEAVAPASVIAELALALFYLLAVLFHILRSRAEGRRLDFYLLSLGSFTLGVFLKETALTAIAVMAAFDLAFPRKGGGLRRFIMKDAPRLVPYAAVFAAYLAIRHGVLGGLVPFAQHGELDAFQYVLNVFPLLAGYLKLLVLPVGLNAFYTFHPVHSATEWTAVLSILAVLATAAAVYRFRTNRLVLFSATWFVISLSPALYLPGVGVRGAAFAERYLYIPSAGFAVIAGLFACGIYRRLGTSKAPKTALYAAAEIVAALLFYGTAQRNRVWKDDFTLWTDTLTKAKDSEVVYVNLGEALAERGRIDEAAQNFKEALALNPDSFEASLNMGAALLKTSRPEEAAEYFRRALGINPASAEAASGLGVALATLGRLEEAKSWSLRAAGLDPSLAEPFTTLGIIAATRGDFNGAISRFTTALSLDPGNPDIHYNLAVTYIRSGMPDMAAAHLREVLRLDPTDGRAARDLERLMKTRGEER